MELKGNYQVIGPPGTGKTTWVCNQVEKCLNEGQNVLLASMTRTAAVEIRNRNLNVHKESIGTLHAHCFHVLDRPKIAEGLIPLWNKEYGSLALTCQVDLDESDCDWSEGGSGDELYRQYTLFRSKMIPRENWNERVLEFARLWEGWKSEIDCLDFCDLIEKAGKYCLPPETPDVFLIDECQDSSALEINGLIKPWSNYCQATIMIGDPYQCLYAWRGSTPEIFLNPDFEITDRKVLPVSYRFGEEIKAKAIQWLSQHNDYQNFEYRSRPDSHGSVSNLSSYMDRFDSWFSTVEEHLANGETVMILTSCGYMIKPLVDFLKSQGIPFHNPYRIKRGDWNPLHGGKGRTVQQRILDFCRPNEDYFGANARAWNHGELWSWVEICEAKGLIRHGAKKQIEDMEKFDPTVLVRPTDLEEFFHMDKLVEMELDTYDPVKLEEILLPKWKKKCEYALEIVKKHGPKKLTERPKIILGTIHSVKGGEADNVFIFPDLSRAGWLEWCSGDRDSIIRQFYVALTRARKRIYLMAGKSNFVLPIGV